MSLDVYLKLEGAQTVPEERIYIRADGRTMQITRAEWDRLHPDRAPVTVMSSGGDEVYAANITHNLNAMATEAGIYDALWRPEEIGIAFAEQLVAPLRIGLALLRSQPEHFKQFNPEGGWGTYDGLVIFVMTYLAACERYPAAIVEVSR